MMAHLCSAHIGNKTFTLPRFGSKRNEQKTKEVRRKDDIYGFLPGKDRLPRTGTLPARLRTKSPARQAAAHQDDSSALRRHQSATLGRRPAASPRSPDVSTPLTIHIPSDSPGVPHSPHQSTTPVRGCVVTQRQPQSPDTPTVQLQSPDCLQKDWHACKQPLYTSLNSSGNSLNDSGIDSGLDSSRRTDCSQQSSSGSATDSPGASVWSRAKADVKRRLEQSSAALAANIPMLVTRDYTPPSGRSTRVPVRRGMIVNAQYKTDEWVYVKTSLDTDGFVPYSCVDCMGAPKLARDFSQHFAHDEQPLNTPGRPYVWSLLDKMKNDADTSVEVRFGLDQGDNSCGSPCAEESFGNMATHNNMHVLGAYNNSQLSLIPHIGSDCSMTEETSSLDMSIDSTTTESSIFCKERGAELTVLFNYDGLQEDDVTVRKGDIVTLLNDEDPDWMWVRTEDDAEGFVPSCYVVDLGKLNLDPRAPTTYL